MDNRSNNFDCVRLLAALAVIYGHAFPLAMASSPTLLGNSIQAFAVKIFFTISGFLICKSWMASPNIGVYLAKRTLRIFPALIVLVLLTALVVGPVLSDLSLDVYYSNATVIGYLKNIFLYPVYNLVDLFANNAYPSAVNGSLWSLPVEFFMYLLITLLAVKGAGSKLPVLWIGTAVIVAMSLRFVHYVQPPAHPVLYGTDLISALDVAPYFLIGAMYSYYGFEKYLNLGMSLFLIGFVVLFQPVSPVWNEIFLYAVAPYAILSFATAKTAFLHRFGRFGDMSYGIYLYGFFLQQIVNAMTKNSLTPLENALVSMPFAIACAYVSWHVVEKPALRLKTGFNFKFSGGK
ncbi:acyltransferase [Pseudomonas alliivorans]|uniref:acyltransferase family protein n=1 Tax=Pseudomonas alliivorans TaxID=2810613 RepID=UPI001AE82D59|nr:acyltransferase [Pseudomonas alliivorans]MBP0952511.1 acyltransferase [Pseudomonas alliivorans]MEE4574875.1 acyltransferase [Pseudomonas alliivorans]MEE4672321.1 acyltransferase [Pseudomonas alliivorans]MEE4686347.1 acyltransferase [Pseudomonas alliivorans]MEE4708235.1 acyltransferase [Pseudomonas alliivorans]